MNLKLIISFILIALVHIDVEAQKNKLYQMPDSGAQWNVVLNIRECCCARYSYTLTGDTFVNGKKYEKIWKAGSTYMPTSSGWCDFKYQGKITKEYAGAIRQDTVLRKVYFLPKSFSADTLLYDFNAKEGDTIKTFITPMPLMVKKVDSILIKSVYRKRWILNNPIEDLEIIEGIGSNYGLLERLIRPIEGRTYLVCFSAGNEQLYPDFNPNAGCELMVNLPNTVKVNPIFNIHPNPTNGAINITSSESDFGIEIFNALGQSVYKAASNFELKIYNLSKGIYYVRFIGDRVTATQKLLIK